MCVLNDIFKRYESPLKSFYHNPKQIYLNASFASSMVLYASINSLNSIIS